MIRLQQSQITMTQRDIDSYKFRSDAQRMATLIRNQRAFVDNIQDTVEDIDIPQIRHGAQRFRDDAIVRSNITCIARSAEADTSSTSPGEMQYSVETKASPLQGRQRSIRRDSVLSNEESTDVNEIHDQIGEGRSVRSNSSTSISPPRSPEALHSGQAKSSIRRWNKMPRRYRPRSFSDPCETPLSSLHIPRTRETDFALTNRPASKDRTTHHDSDIRTDTVLASVPEDHDLTSPAGWQHDVAQHTSEGRPRHHSLPVGTGSVGQWSTCKLCKEVDGYCYCTESFPYHQTSPLGTLEEQIKTLSMTKNTEPEEQLCVPSSEISEAASDGNSTDTIVAVGNTVDIDSDEILSSPDRHESTTRWQARSDHTRRTTSKSLSAYHTMIRGGRPRIGAIFQDREGPARRRNQNPEQENEEDMQQFHMERETRAARNGTGIGGVIENTPPPQGRLERLLG